MDTSTIKQALLTHLQGKDWEYGGTICREISPKIKHKEAVIERHGLRSSLVKGDDSLIERRFVENPSGKGAKVLQYRLRKVEPNEAKKGITTAIDSLTGRELGRTTDGVYQEKLAI